MSRFTRIPLTRFRQYSVWSMDGTLVVFSQQTGSVQVLDDLAAWLLLSLDAGLTQSEIASEFRGQGYDEALLDVAYATIDKLGQKSANPSDYAQEYAHVLASVPDLAANAPDGIGFSVLGKVFELQTNIPALRDYWHTLDLPGKRVNPENVDYRLEVRKENTTYQLVCNGIPLVGLHDYAHILPVLMDHIQIIAYQSVDYLLSLHAAVVSIQGKGILLPGCSGSGKSTLAAHLIQQGHICYSDEVAVISAQTLRAMPVPLPAALKSGSWDLIGGMDNLPIWSRVDGRISKYINLPNANQTLAELPVACIIFPRYDANQQTAEMLPLTPLVTLQRLTESGYQIRNTLTANKVERILSWVNSLPAYQLHYSTFTQANPLIRQSIP